MDGHGHQHHSHGHDGMIIYVETGFYPVLFCFCFCFFLLSYPVPVPVFLIILFTTPGLQRARPEIGMTAIPQQFIL